MYILAIFGVIVVVVLTALMTQGMSGGWIMMIDFPSLFLLVLIGVPVLLASGLGKDFINAFHLALGKEKQAGLTELKRASEAADCFMKVIRYGSVFIAVLEFINIYNVADDPQLWRANLVVTSTVLLYAFAINILMLPVKYRLNTKVINYMESAEEPEKTEEAIE